MLETSCPREVDSPTNYAYLTSIHLMLDKQPYYSLDTMIYSFWVYKSPNRQISSSFRNKTSLSFIHIFYNSKISGEAAISLILFSRLDTLNVNIIYHSCANKRTTNVNLLRRCGNLVVCVCVHTRSFAV